MTEPQNTDSLPRIYIASLSDYNNGKLHGTWVDPTRSLQEISKAVTRMLSSSTCQPAEDWAIHDYEGFGDTRISENATLGSVRTLALAMNRERRQNGVSP
jgi:antirestriction protein